MKIWVYLEHMNIALNIALRVQLIALVILIHAIFPFLFEYIGGDEIEQINEELQHRRSNERKLD